MYPMWTILYVGQINICVFADLSMKHKIYTHEYYFK